MKKQFTLGWTVLVIILVAAVITASTLYIQPTSFQATLKLIAKQPLIGVLNYLPVLLILIVIYFGVNNLFYSAAITSGILNICSMINTIKIELRDEPFSPKDIVLIKEAMNTVSDFNVQIKYELIGLIIFEIVVFIVLGHLIHTQKLSKKARIIGGLISIGMIFGLNKGVYSSQDIYTHKLEVTNRRNITKIYNELGFIYCFLYNLNSDPVEKPEHFSEEEIRAFINTYAQANKELLEVNGELLEVNGELLEVNGELLEVNGELVQEHEALIETNETQEDKKPHVIFIMSEAFSDIGMYAPFTYTEDNTPYKYWQEVLALENTISGHIVTPNFGGGTANTEFDVMTGMQTNMLSSVPTYAFRVLDRQTQSLATVFKENDYKTLFIHPGDSWFYNREKAYEYLGMDEMIFSEAFSETDKKGNMIADSVLTKRVINAFERHRKEMPEQPIFTYVTSIQNHMPYTADKYGDLRIEEVQTSKTLSKTAKDYLSVYMEGIEDASTMLKDLTTYFEAQEQPVIIVFFGDHLPNLGDDYLSYKELGLPVGEDEDFESVIKTYTTPYVIWSNQEAAELLDIKEREEKLKLPEDNKISANYLGAMILELLGYEGQEPFFDYINELRKTMPIIYKDIYKIEDKGYTSQLTTEEETLVNNLRYWEYYKMRCQIQLGTGLKK